MVKVSNLKEKSFSINRQDELKQRHFVSVTVFVTARQTWASAGDLTEIMTMKNLTFDCQLRIDLSAILQKGLDRALFLHFYTRCSIEWRLKLLSLWRTFENSKTCSKISFDSDSF